MILAYHVIFGAYGFWLPNDPRGSWSTFVGAWELARFGKATKVTTRRSLARNDHDVRQRIAAKKALRFPAVQFSGTQARAIGRGLARACVDGGYTVYACSILPEHVHLVTGRCERSVERVVGHLKGGATRQLEAEGLHPFAGQIRPGGRRPSPWAEGSWKVYLDSLDAVVAAIRYVDDNPLKEGKHRQRWSFVVPWAGNARTANGPEPGRGPL